MECRVVVRNTRELESKLRFSKVVEPDHETIAISMSTKAIEMRYRNSTELSQRLSVH